MTGERLLTAFLDANALYPAELRNLLMRLGLAEAYLPAWSDRVQKESTEALARDRPDLPRVRIERLRALMEQHIPLRRPGRRAHAPGPGRSPCTRCCHQGRGRNPCDRQPHTLSCDGTGPIRH